MHCHMTAQHIYVDETKERGYLLVAARFNSADVDAVRKSLRGLVLRGQSRIHMAKESSQRRRAIAAAMSVIGVTATIYDAGRRYSDPLDARRACLEGILKDVERGQQTYLVLEQDDSIIDWDRQRLVELTRATGCRHTLRYEHHRAKADLLLTVPDAIAWCWARDGPWRPRIAPIVAAVQQV